MKFKKPPHIRKILFALVVLAVFTACSFAFSNKNEMTYLTENVTRGDVIRKVTAAGEVTSARLVAVGAQASGQIKNLYVQLGQMVNAGDPIAEIDSTTQRNELETRKARLKTYKAQLASREVALKVATHKYKREASLKRQDATSMENLENAENALTQAQAALEETLSLIVQEQTAVSTAEANLSYTRITAPVRGTVVSIPVEAGQTVNASQSTPTIVQLADLEHMEIKIQISEGDVTKVSAGMPVSYSILSEPGTEYSTTLRSIDPAMASISNEKKDGVSTDSAIYYYGRLLVENQSGKLRIGMTTQNSIYIARAENVLRVPGHAVRKRGGKSYVTVLKGENTLEERPVNAGLADSVHIAVLEGLEEGEKVVIAQMPQREIDTQLKRPRR